MPTIKNSIVLPVYNEVAIIDSTIRNLVASVRERASTAEIIIVDDGSVDGTKETCLAIRQEFPDLVRVVTHLRNRGYGASLRSGCAIAAGEILIFMDADGQHQPGEIPKLLDHIPPYDMVIGTRGPGFASGGTRSLANWFFNRFASWLSRMPIIDITSGFRAMRREALHHFLPLFPDGFSASVTSTLLFLKAGYNVLFVPVEVQPRKHGESKIQPFQDAIRFVTIILRMIMLYDPLRIFLPVSLAFVLLGVAAWVLGVLNAGRLIVPNSTTLLFVAGSLTLMLGLISSQILGYQVHYYGDETILVDGEPYTRSDHE
jgi:glycosyltransferase involved in cell wall biosynthesis